MRSKPYLLCKNKKKTREGKLWNMEKVFNETPDFHFPFNFFVPFGTERQPSGIIVVVKLVPNPIMWVNDCFLQLCKMFKGCDKIIKEAEG